jgi:phasin family protein
MTETTSYIEMLRKFGHDLGLPKLNVEELLNTQLREAVTLAREYKPLGKVHENLALQTEFARKMFEIALLGAQQSVTAARQSTTEAVKIVQDRMKESLEEIRASVRRDQSV